MTGATASLFTFYFLLFTFDPSSEASGKLRVTLLNFDFSFSIPGNPGSKSTAAKDC